VKLTEYLPALPEDLLKKYGGKYVKADQDWGEKVAIGRSGRLITGQNPASGARASSVGYTTFGGLIRSFVCNV
jgi:putative intracellular protease/amidase